VRELTKLLSEEKGKTQFSAAEAIAVSAKHHISQSSLTRLSILLQDPDPGRRMYASGILSITMNPEDDASWKPIFTKDIVQAVVDARLTETTPLAKSHLAYAFDGLSKNQPEQVCNALTEKREEAIKKGDSDTAKEIARDIYRILQKTFKKEGPQSKSKVDNTPRQILQPLREALKMMPPEEVCRRMNSGEKYTTPPLKKRRVLP